MTFYLAKNAAERFRVFTKFSGEYIEIDHIYIYAEDFGVFPQVKFVEFLEKVKPIIFIINCLWTDKKIHRLHFENDVYFIELLTYFKLYLTPT